MLSLLTSGFSLLVLLTRTGLLDSFRQKKQNFIFSVWLIEFFLPPGVNCQHLTAMKTEESTLEGSSVTLSYNYSQTAVYSDYFFWYRQYPGKPPEFLISLSGTGDKLQDPFPGFSFKVSADKTQMDLQISSAAVTDSAVYYCAVRPTVTGNTRTLYKNLQYSTTSTRGPHTLLNH
ncbi:hypothetical protein CHARACLAT_028215 [Characodon lateralis]|uniref:Ig-like domain-containing protein n=1 Tax=Characodon lateralis TaxID=208331 RepID=A0ABU7ER53_9TELE|nr:hypothetical protein [Characodon lateralis]